MRIYCGLSLIILAAAFAGGRSLPAGQMEDSFRTAVTHFTKFFEWFGEFGAFCGRVARVAFTPPFEWRELIRQMDAIGSKSLPLAALAGAATGVVLSLQTRDSLTRFGAKSMLPGVIVYSLMKESGPVITGLVVSGRV
jgi:phospholipid/cholesterol/gamma-HCH transport system permease protein